MALATVCTLLEVCSEAAATMAAWRLVSAAVEDIDWAVPSILADAADKPDTAVRGLRSSRQPRYLQVSETLREEIRRGEHPVGKAFPTEAVLCKRFKISRFTARAALQLLTDQGLILRRRGAGTLVRSAETRVTYEQHIRNIDDLLQYTNATGFQFLHTDRVVADSVLAGWLFFVLVERHFLNTAYDARCAASVRRSPSTKETVGA